MPRGTKQSDMPEVQVKGAEKPAEATEAPTPTETVTNVLAGGSDAQASVMSILSAGKAVDIDSIKPSTGSASIIRAWGGRLSGDEFDKFMSDNSDKAFVTSATKRLYYVQHIKRRYKLDDGSEGIETVTYTFDPGKPTPVEPSVIEELVKRNPVWARRLAAWTRSGSTINQELI